MSTRRTFLYAGAAWALAPHSISAQGTAWPGKPVRMVVPSAAGSPWDPLARHLAERFSKAFDQTFYVENRSGGTGMIGMDQVAKSLDGHSLGVMFMPHAVLPSIVAKMPYDTLKDLVPIGQTQWTYNVLVVRSGVPASSVAELLAHVKKNPGKLIYSSGGNGALPWPGGSLARAHWRAVGHDVRFPGLGTPAHPKWSAARPGRDGQPEARGLAGRSDFCAGRARPVRCP